MSPLRVNHVSESPTCPVTASEPQRRVRAGGEPALGHPLGPQSSLLLQLIPTPSSTHLSIIPTPASGCQFCPLQQASRVELQVALQYVQRPWGCSGAWRKSKEKPVPSPPPLLPKPLLTQSIQTAMADPFLGFQVFAWCGSGGRRSGVTI